MEGSVSSYLPSKGYGFLKGDDGRDYFLHRSDLLATTEPFEGQRMSFEESSTPKGYRARKVKPLASTKAAKYRLPDQVVTSKIGSHKDWDVLLTTSWSITGDSRDSPDAAWDLLRTRARLIGANAVLHARYFKTTGSERGSGRGTHYYTIHNVSGVAAFVGKLSADGALAASAIPRIDEQAAQLKAELDAKTQSSYVTAAIAAPIVGLIVAAVGGLNMIAAGVGVVLAIVTFSAIAGNYGYWLQRS